MCQRLHLIVAKVAAMNHVSDRNEWRFDPFDLDAAADFLAQTLYEAEA